MADSAPFADTPPACPHCGETLSAMTMPAMAQFDSPWIWVCFNDGCGYYLRGWDRMEQQTGMRTSYRHKLDPFTGETGPLPVWSEDAMRDLIITPDNA